METKWIYDRFGGYYNYNRITVDEVNDELLEKLTKREKRKHRKSGTNIKTVVYKKGKYSKSFIELYCGFDIETTKCKNNDSSFMYKWQFSLNKYVVSGRTFEELLLLFNKLKKLQYETNIKLCVWVANLGFEYQFIHKYLNITDYFFKELREPVYIEHDNFIQFRECLSFGGSLKKLAEDYTILYKMVGDLDYSKYRVSSTKLTEKEEKYCDLDVLILSEFSKYFFETFFKNLQNPLTIQSVLRNKIKNNISNLDYWKEKIKKQYPSEELYKIVMNYLYRGGYCHGKMEFVGKLFKIWENARIKSFDITSSYPSSMLHGYYPEKFYKTTIKSKEDLEFLLKYKCMFATFKFTNIKAKLGHSIESITKCLELENPIVDNGRVLSADKMTVILTELDYDIYKKFYSWDNVEIFDVYLSEKHKMPRELLTPMLQDYEKKSVLKSEHKPYSIEKSYVNSYYGMFVTRLVEKNIIYENGESKIGDIRKWEEMTKNEILNPFQGLYITAHSRHKLLDMVYRLETLDNPCIVLYCDTDSIKYIENENNDGERLFNEESNKMFELNKKYCKEYNLKYEYFKDLGAWDYEHGKPFETFKYLGAKRYLFTIKDGNIREYNSTIAGLPKKWYIKNYGKSLSKFYGKFKDGMLCEKCKLGSKYIDEETLDDDGNIIKSCVSLIDTDFQMSLNSMWLNVMNEYKSESRENRVL